MSGTVFDVWPCAADGTNTNYLSCGSTLNAGEPTPACLIPNSGWQCAQDYERGTTDETLLVEINLD